MRAARRAGYAPATDLSNRTQIALLAHEARLI